MAVCMFIIQLFWSCSVGRQHLTDQSVECLFGLHARVFGALVADICNDSKCESDGRTTLSYSSCGFEEDIGVHGPKCRGFTGEQWSLFQNSLAAAQVVRAVRLGGEVEFFLDEPSVFNGESVNLNPAVDGSQG